MVIRTRVFPLHHLSMGSSGLVSNKICFCISVKKNRPVQAHRLKFSFKLLDSILFDVSSELQSSFKNYVRLQDDEMSELGHTTNVKLVSA